MTSSIGNMRGALRDWWLSGHVRYAYEYPLIRRAPVPPRKVRVLGDHSNYHCGSRAAIESIRLNCQRSGYLLAGRYEPFDILVVNGEGSMHGSLREERNVFRKKMEVLKKAVERGIPAYLVNTLWQDNISDYDDVLCRLSGIQVREAESQRALKELHGVDSTVKIDASFFLPVDTTGPGVRRAGIIATDFFVNVRGRFESHRLELADVAYVSMAEISWQGFVMKLATSQLLVTGRHHAVYAAAKARTPFVLVKGNNHKVTGLLASADARIPFARDLSEVAEVMRQVPHHIAEFEKLFEWMHAQPDTPILPARLLR